mgnify:CR=1 FL=1
MSRLSHKSSNSNRAWKDFFQRIWSILPICIWVQLKGNNAYHLVLAQIKHEMKHFGKALFSIKSVRKGFSHMQYYNCIVSILSWWIQCFLTSDWASLVAQMVNNPPVRLQSLGLQRVGSDWATFTFILTSDWWFNKWILRVSIRRVANFA